MPEKSAEEYVDLWRLYSQTLPLDDDDEFRKLEADFYRKIQRNAKHAAMLEAAEIVNSNHLHSNQCLCASCVATNGDVESILTAAKKYED